MDKGFKRFVCFYNVLYLWCFLYFPIRVVCLCLFVLFVRPSLLDVGDSSGITGGGRCFYHWGCG